MIRPHFFALLLALTIALPTSVLAQNRTFTAETTDADGIQMSVSNARLYWEEKIDETTFVPHEITHVPVKHGAATINVKFQQIAKIHVKPDHPAKGRQALTIKLLNGKSGEFPLAKEVTLIGQSDFGEIRIPMQSLRTLTFSKKPGSQRSAKAP